MYWCTNLSSIMYNLSLYEASMSSRSEAGKHVVGWRPSTSSQDL